ncbi:MAG TPA: cyclase family protein [Actinophytocola sp.]|jgi:kynurenine formamidase|nr:cyclase family protein [Actinophytocola sp.]
MDSLKSRWGRWGTDDERGALNFADQAATLRGIGLVRRGESFSLCIPIRRSGPFAGTKTRNRPLHLMRLTGGDYADAAQGQLCVADDYVFLPTHGCTHIDALCHAWSDGQLYNGFPSSSVRTSGARKLSVHTIGPVLTRGILVDIPGLLGVPYLEKGFVISRSHVEEALRRQGIGGLESGDAVLFRTGWLGAYDELGAETFEGDSRPGIGREVAEWLVDGEACAVGADTAAVEVVPGEDGTMMPLHLELLRNQGLPLIELLVLDELAAAGHFEFLLALNPLPVVGGTGGPLAPIAVV